jgi:hypothetical protein
MMERKASISLLILFLFYFGSTSSVAFASSGDWVEWSETYGGIEDDGEFHLVYLVQTFDGGITIAANTRSFGSGFSDCWLIKVDSSGNIEWNQTYGGKNENKNLLTYLPLLLFCFVPESFQPPSSDVLLPHKK